MIQENTPQRWAYTPSYERLTATKHGSANDLYNWRRAWLERQFLELCEKRGKDRAEVQSRRDKRAKRTRRHQELRNLRTPEGYARADAIATIAMDGWRPPECGLMLDEWLKFLRDALCAYGDLLFQTREGEPAAVSDFISHRENLLRDLLERRWPLWRERLDFPKGELSDVEHLLRTEADRITVEMEKSFWSEVLIPSTEASGLTSDTAENSSERARLNKGGRPRGALANGTEIKRRREGLHLTQPDLADKCNGNMTVFTIRRAESGRSIDPKSIAAIAEAFTVMGLKTASSDLTIAQ